MEVKIGISARHIHLNKTDCELLFGKDYQLTEYRKLNQPGEFATQETVTIKTDEYEFNNVRVIGPIRNYTQVEISKTDSYLLGINPPIRNSGDLEGAAMVKIIGPKGTIERACCIIANRHIHVNKQDLETYGLVPNQIVKVKVDTIKGGIMDNVHVKYNENYAFEMHIDLDDANAHFLNHNDIGYIIK
jgi:putative phosphotransacetylase